jgi:drug/metabolite transporter (DMT)-like permease
MVIAVALAAAACYAVAMVLQHRSAGETDPALSLRWGLVADLAKRPLWLAGVVANIAGFGLRFVALGAGSLSVVQPVLVTSLLFALPLSARWHHQPLTGRDWSGAIAIAAGISLFIVSAAPSTGRTDAPAAAWLATIAAIGAVTGVLLALGHRTVGPTRAALLAAGGGALLASTAALAKVAASGAREQHFHVLATWSPYVFLAVTAVGVVVVQSAFAAASLTASLPVLMVIEPLASVVLGVALFREHLAGEALARAGTALGLAAMAVGVWVVARSAAISSVATEAPERGPVLSPPR